MQLNIHHKKRETKLKREHLNRSNCHITVCTTCKNSYRHNFYRNGSYKHLTHCTNGRFKDRNELGFRIYKQINCIREHIIPYKNLNKKTNHKKYEAACNKEKKK